MAMLRDYVIRFESQINTTTSQDSKIIITIDETQFIVNGVEEKATEKTKTEKLPLVFKNVFLNDKRMGESIVDSLGNFREWKDLIPKENSQDPYLPN